MSRDLSLQKKKVFSLHFLQNIPLLYHPKYHRVPSCGREIMLPFSEFHFANFSLCNLKVNTSPSVCCAAHLPVRDIKPPPRPPTFLRMSGPVGHLIRLRFPLSVTALPFPHSACRADILICHNRLCSTGLSLTNSKNSHICFVSPDPPSG